MSKPPLFSTYSKPRVLLLAIHAPYNKTKIISSYYDEFVNLADANGLSTDLVVYMKLRTIEPQTFLSSGKLAELKEICEKEQPEEIIISEALSPHQERNLSKMLDCRVYDRTQLILEIFEKRAHSAEGKTQVEIAMLSYRKARLAGQGINLSQQAGHTGGKGPGETAKEKELRYLNTTTLQLKKKLKQLQRVRETQRKNRLSNAVPTVCLVGYTNAGKSTILNALTRAGVDAEDKPFATLDTTTRELYIDGKKLGIISDTVGFIQQLPHDLVEAFKSTLSELQHADLLLNVVDISDPKWETDIRVVQSILDELNLDKKMLYVFNKSDKCDDIKSTKLAVEKYTPQVFTTATSKEGIAPLVKYLSGWKK